MLSKLLAASFTVIFLGRMFFRPQLRALGVWLDGLVNALLIAIALTWTVQLLIYLATS